MEIVLPAGVPMTWLTSTRRRPSEREALLSQGQGAVPGDDPVERVWVPALGVSHVGL